jgi:hypothetical protein
VIQEVLLRARVDDERGGVLFLWLRQMERCLNFVSGSNELTSGTGYPMSLMQIIGSSQVMFT